MRAPVAGALALLVAGGCADRSGDSDSQVENVKVADRGSIPIDEVSGITLRASGDDIEILAIGDHSAKVMVARLTKDIDHLEFHDVDLEPAFERGRLGFNAQWEAIATDGMGRVALLEEDPGHVYVLSRDLHTIETSIELDVEGSDIADEWRSSANARGEGLVLLDGGHLLIAKEKEPRRIIEFGPKGAEPVGFRVLPQGRGFEPAQGKQTFVPLRSWKLAGETKDSFPDLSELTMADGIVYVLSDQGRRIGRLGPTRGDEVTIVDDWSVSHVDKPEGLAILGDRTFVASDGTGKHNLFEMKKLK